MGLLFNKAKVEDYLKQVGSVDSTRNIAFESGAQYQLNQDNIEYTKLENENQDLKGQLKLLQTAVDAAKAERAAKKAAKVAAPSAPATPATPKK